MKKVLMVFALLPAMLYSCKNRSLSESEEFQPREIHENIQFHFDKITVDGVEYLILEKDNNNPHEGFGFMAFRANKLVEKQDSIIAYLQTVQDIQSKIYAKVSGISEQSATIMAEDLFNNNLGTLDTEIRTLEQTDLEGNTNDDVIKKESPNN